jgi:dTDP-4-amino-4,6-dideoxygalactose transaminase
LLAISIAFSRYFYGVVNKLEQSGLLNCFVKYFDEIKIDMPKDYLQPLTAVEARVGLIQCEKYQGIVRHRSVLANVYNIHLACVTSFKLPPIIDGATYSHYVIVTDRAELILAQMKEHGFQLGELIDYCIPMMSSYKNHRSYDTGVASQWPGNVINLPVHVGCSIDDAIKICQHLREIVSVEDVI